MHTVNPTKEQSADDTCENRGEGGLELLMMEVVFWVGTAPERKTISVLAGFFFYGFSFS